METLAKNVETWEITTTGTVWVWVKDPREGGYKKQRVGGRSGGSRRLHISVDDRRFNTEQVVDEMEGHNPFSNGILRLVSVREADDIDTKYHKTDDELVEMLAVRDQDAFEQAVREIKSELLVRRLYAAAEVSGTVGQVTFLRDLIDETWRVGGSQRTVREMLAAGELSGGQSLS